MKKSWMVGVVASIPALAMAQPSAIVRTTLSDPATNLPVGVAQPGQTVRMRTVVSWQPSGSQMAGIKGDMLAWPVGVGGQGVVTNRVSDYTAGGLVHLGTLAGDDLMDIDIAVTPAFFTGGFIVPPSWNSTGLLVIGYDWTAPAEVGTYEFRFAADPIAPNFRVYPSPSSPMFAEVPTIYVGTSLVVVPGPGGAALVAVAALGAGRRRRIR